MLHEGKVFRLKLENSHAIRLEQNHELSESGIYADKTSLAALTLSERHRPGNKKHIKQVQQA
jgi:hypothetical protein